MTIELFISLIALALSVFAVLRTFINGEKKEMDTEIQMDKLKNCSFEKANSDNKPEDVYKKTLQSIEDYRK